MAGLENKPLMSIEELYRSVSALADIVFEDIKRLDNQRLNLSEALAIKDYGIDQVAEAARAAGDKLASFVDEHHPYDALMQWYKVGQFKAAAKS